jgi:hypothetical protein
VSSLHSDLLTGSVNGIHLLEIILLVQHNNPKIIELEVDDKLSRG